MAAPRRRPAWTQTTNRDRYGPEHRKERARWEPTVQAGEAFCQQGIPGNGSSGTCLHRTRWIRPGSRWALGHNDQRTTWIGPVHADCNHADASRRGGQTTAHRYGTNGKPPPRTATRQPWHSRTW